MITSTKVLVDELNDEDKINGVLQTITGVVTNIIGHMSGLIAALLTGLTNLLKETGVTPAKLEAAKSVGDIMKGVGEIMKAIIPSPQTLEAFRTTQSTYGEGGNSIAGIDSRALTEYMNAVIGNLTTIIGNNTSGVLGMVRSVATMSISPSEIERLKGVAPIIEAIGNLISHIVPSQNILDRITQQVSGSENRGDVAGGNRNRIKWFMENVKDNLTNILPTIKTFISDIADKIASISPSSVEGLKGIAPIVSAVGSLIQNLMPSTAILERITEGTRSGGLTTTQMESNKTKIGEFFTTLTTYFNNLFLGTSSSAGAAREGGIIGFLKGISDILNSMSLDETKIKGLTAISGLVTTIANMIVPIMGALQAFGQNMSSTDASVIWAQGQQIQNIITAVTNAISGMFTTQIPTLVRSITTMDFGRIGARGLESRTKAIKGIFDLVGSLSSIISGFKAEGGTGGEHGGYMNMYYDVFFPIISLLEFLFTGVGGNRLGAVIAALAGEGFKNLANIGTRVKNLKALFEAISTIATSAKTLKDNFTGADSVIDVATLTPAFTSIQNILNMFIGPHGAAAFLVATGGANDVFAALTKAHRNVVGQGRGSKGMGEKLSDITTQLGTLKSSASTLNTSLQDVETISLDQLNTGFNKMKDNLNNILSSMDGFISQVDNDENESRIGRILNSIGRGSFLSQVRTAVTAYGNFSRQLAELTQQIGGHSFDADLHTLGATVTGNAEHTFRTAISNVQVNVNIRLEAGQVANALWHYSNAPSSTGNGGAAPPYGFTPGSQRGAT